MEFLIMRNPPSTIPRGARAAFSLVELLVVMGIISLLLVLGTAGFSSIFRASRLSSSGQLVQSEIMAARQQAVTFSREVEVRFFQTGSGTNRVWNGVQGFSVDGAGNWAALRRAVLLPDGVVMDEVHSTLLASAPVSGTTNFGSHGSQAYRAFRFRPGGNTQMALTTNNNTLILRGTGTGNPSSLPANFFAFVVTPINGKTLTFQP